VETAHFEPVIVHRDLFQERVWYARAEVVVEDAPDRTLLYWPPGAEVRVPVRAGGAPLRIPESTWILEDRPWHSFHVLCHWLPSDHHSVWLFWEADTWHFDAWYVNLQSPFTRTPLGFDATDDFLDIVVEPDRSWAWKDEDELEEVVRRNLVVPSLAAAIRSEGERVIQRIQQTREPFTNDWIDWRPDERWPIPELLDGWDAYPSGAVEALTVESGPRQPSCADP
jgi:hypothetical protein